MKIIIKSKVPTTISKQQIITALELIDAQNIEIKLKENVKKIHDLHTSFKVPGNVDFNFIKDYLLASGLFLESKTEIVVEEPSYQQINKALNPAPLKEVKASKEEQTDELFERSLVIENHPGIDLLSISLAKKFPGKIKNAHLNFKDDLILSINCSEAELNEIKNYITLFGFESGIKPQKEVGKLDFEALKIFDLQPMISKCFSVTDKYTEEDFIKHFKELRDDIQKLIEKMKKFPFFSPIMSSMNKFLLALDSLVATEKQNKGEFKKHNEELTQSLLELQEAVEQVSLMKVPFATKKVSNNNRGPESKPKKVIDDSESRQMLNGLFVALFEKIDNDKSKNFSGEEFLNHFKMVNSEFNEILNYIAAFIPDYQYKELASKVSFMLNEATQKPATELSHFKKTNDYFLENLKGFIESTGPEKSYSFDCI